MKINIGFKIFIFFCAVEIQTNSALCQDKILLISGREIPCVIVKITDFDILYRKPISDKEKSIERDAVYSVNFANGNSVFIYKPDADFDDEMRYSYKEMRMFITGEQDAHKGFKSPASFVLSFAVGFAGGFFLDPFYGPIVPAVFSFVAGIPEPRIQPHTVSNPNFITEEPYILGYRKTAKIKKIQSLVKGSILGLIGGIGVHLAVKNL